MSARLRCEETAASTSGLRWGQSSGRCRAVTWNIMGHSSWDTDQARATGGDDLAGPLQEIGEVGTDAHRAKAAVAPLDGLGDIVALDDGRAALRVNRLANALHRADVVHGIVLAGDRVEAQGECQVALSDQDSVEAIDGDDLVEVVESLLRLDHRDADDIAVLPGDREGRICGQQPQRSPTPPTSRWI